MTDSTFGSKNQDHDDLLREVFRDHEDTTVDRYSAEPLTRPHTPSVGELDLEDRSRLRGVMSHTDMTRTEREDGYDVEYRKLRLERVVLVGVWTEGTAAEIDAAMEELKALAETAGSEVVDTLYQKRDKPDPGTYIGQGKVSELKVAINAHEADTVVCDGELSPGQMIALEKALDVKVIDRTMLILDIFRPARQVPRR